MNSRSDGRINSASIPLCGDFGFLQISQLSVAGAVLLIGSRSQLKLLLLVCRFRLESAIVDHNVPCMEEAEVLLEDLHERVRESAEHTNAVWISWVALSTAVLAAQFVMSHM